MNVKLYSYLEKNVQKMTFKGEKMTEHNIKKEAHYHYDNTLPEVTLIRLKIYQTYNAIFNVDDCIFIT